MPKQPPIFEQVEKLRRQRPFQSFTIALESGERFRITDPFHIGWATEGLAVALYVPRRDRFVHFTKDKVTAVEATKSRGRNGRPR